MLDLLSQIHTPGQRLVGVMEQIVCDLTDWVEDTGGLSETPCPSFRWSNGYACVSVGDICVWDTEDTGEELTVESCKAEFLKHVENLACFLNAEDSEVNDD